MAKSKKTHDALIIVILNLCTLMLASCEKPYRQENLYGVWKGQSRGVEIVFRFFEDGTCSFRFKKLDSESTDIIRGNLETDFTKSPVPLTVRNIPQLNHPLHTIVEFIREDSIRVANFAPRWRLRPIALDQYTSIGLKRVDRNPSAKI